MATIVSSYASHQPVPQQVNVGGSRWERKRFGMWQQQQAQLNAYVLSPQGIRDAENRKLLREYEEESSQYQYLNIPSAVKERERQRQILDAFFKEKNLATKTISEFDEQQTQEYQTFLGSKDTSYTNPVDIKTAWSSLSAQERVDAYTKTQNPFIFLKPSEMSDLGVNPDFLFRKTRETPDETRERVLKKEAEIKESLASIDPSRLQQYEQLYLTLQKKPDMGSSEQQALAYGGFSNQKSSPFDLYLTQIEDLERSRKSALESERARESSKFRDASREVADKFQLQIKERLEAEISSLKNPETSPAASSRQARKPIPLMSQKNTLRVGGIEDTQEEIVNIPT